MKRAFGILAVVVVLLIGVVCAGCIFNTPSHNTSESCVCECGTPAPVPTENITPVVTTRHRPYSYWVTINPLANITEGTTINITGETNLPVDTRLWVLALPPFRHHDKSHAHILEGNTTMAYVDPGNTSGVNTWVVVVNTTGYLPTGHGRARCDVSVFPHCENKCYNETSFYVNESTD